MAFALISDDPLWIVRRTDGAYINRVWVEGTEAVGATTGLLEPYRDGQESITLPSGYDVVDAYMLSTEDTSLQVADPEAEIEADFITEEDPAVVTNTPRFRVVSKAPWKANSSFSLIPTYQEYLVVRERTK